MRFLALSQVILVVLLFVIINAASFAATRTWTGSGTGGAGTDFNDALNWTGIGAMLSTDDLVINADRDGTIIMSGDVEITNLTVSVSGAILLGEFEIDLNGHVLTVNGTASFDGTDAVLSENNVIINCAGAGSHLIINGDASFGPSGSGECRIVANTASPGKISMYANVTFGATTETPDAGDEPNFVFDATGAQLVTCNQASGNTLGASVSFGVSNSPTVTITGAGASRLNTYDGDLVIGAGTTVDVTTGGLDSRLGGVGSEFSMASNAHLILRGAMKLPGENNGAFTSYETTTLNSGSTISYMGTETVLTTSFSYGNLTLNNGSTNTLSGTTIITGDLINEATLDVTASNHELQIQGSWTNNGTFNSRAGKVVFNGSSTQQVLTKDVFYSIDIANSGNIVELNDSMFIDHQVDFSTAGCLDLNGEVLVISDWDDGDFVTLDSNRVVINDGTGGILIEGVDVGDSVNFPLGINSGSEVTYARVDVVNNDVAATSYKACLCNYVNFEGDCSGGTAVVENGINITWQVTSVSTDADMIFYWDTRNEMSGFFRDSLRMNHHNGTDWEFMGDAGLGTEWKTGIYTFSSKATSFSPFGLSNSSGVLPIKLLFFEAQKSDEGLNFSWATAVEINNDHFTIEQSIDGKSFYEIGMVDGQGTVSQVSHYDWSYSGAISRAETYYRLKQTDFDGKATYSDVVIAKQMEELGWSVYPNPVNADQVLQLRTYAHGSSDVEIIVRDASGQVCYQNYFTGVESDNGQSIEGFVKDSGVYFVTIISTENIYTEQVLVR